ncbi:hypothetical protein [Cellulomonas taurus]|jgi:hypothetical protein|uniref:hypothetical protein n=1 Tax=Cellulomonas taurus TaxID=2729175 RepID=UPI00145E80E8|nr:hypothetical protein [Cellulomonas taurus]
MTMSLTRRPARALSIGATALVAVGLLGACASGNGTSDDTTSGSGASASAAAEVTVYDQTGLLLVTAQETFEGKGLTVDVADATGQGRSIDDPTQWVVVTQDPIDGTLPAGSTVTLTARMTTDPATPAN